MKLTYKDAISATGRNNWTGKGTFACTVYELSDEQLIFLKKVTNVIKTFNVITNGAPLTCFRLGRLHNIMEERAYDTYDKPMLNDLGNTYKKHKAPTLEYTESLAVALSYTLDKY